MRTDRIIRVMILVILMCMVSFFSVSRDSHASDYSWAGTWKSDWGKITFRVKGNNVTGNFAHKKGVFTGTLSHGGRVLSGKWGQAPTYNPPKDAGLFVFKMSLNGRSFSGTWWYGYDARKKPNGTWNGTR